MQRHIHYGKICKLERFKPISKNVSDERPPVILTSSFRSFFTSPASRTPTLTKSLIFFDDITVNTLAETSSRNSQRSSQVTVMSVNCWEEEVKPLDDVQTFALRHITEQSCHRLLLSHLQRVCCASAIDFILWKPEHSQKFQCGHAVTLSGSLKEFPTSALVAQRCC